MLIFFLINCLELFMGAVAVLLVFFWGDCSRGETGTATHLLGCCRPISYG